MRPPDLTPDTRTDQSSLPGCLDLSAPAALDIGIQDHAGRLLDWWAQVVHPDPKPIDRTFVDGLVTNLPSLRSFAISLTRSADPAEDLVQETVLRAISKQELFEPGTNLQAWLIAILRNLFCSACRRTKREVEDADGFHAAALISISDQEDSAMLKDLAAALAKLPEGQRKAIMLVGAEGMSYGAAAQSLGCAIGTIQSR
jgi:RNA polymerase sigma-70 factor (ECF subfamily)